MLSCLLLLLLLPARCASLQLGATCACPWRTWRAAASSPALRCASRLWGWAPVQLQRLLLQLLLLLLLTCLTGRPCQAGLPNPASNPARAACSWPFPFRCPSLFQAEGFCYCRGCCRLWLQGDHLSLAGTSWARMNNSWGAKWELRWAGRQSGRLQRAGDGWVGSAEAPCSGWLWGLRRLGASVVAGLPVSIQQACCWQAHPLALASRLCLRVPNSPLRPTCCSGLPETPIDLRITSDSGEALVARWVLGRGGRVRVRGAQLLGAEPSCHNAACIAWAERLPLCLA
jgi:hypothetical protein